MKDLFSMDFKDYQENWPTFVRPSARAVIIREDQVLLVYSKKYNYYKFPGGGIEPGESRVDALIREVAEETGYQIIADSVSEYGRVLRKHANQKGIEEVFEQENFYYFCQVSDNLVERNLDAYEKDEEFTAVWIQPMVAASCNQHREHTGGDRILIKRDQKVLQMVAEERKWRL